jgi:hypothetical protein
MDINAAFNTFQTAVNADPDQVATARERRDLFIRAFTPEADVDEVIPPGSLARRTQRAPINDVDMIIVFKVSEHPDWGEPGDSAADALDYTGGRINALLGKANGTVEKAVRLARPGNHAVKCFLDPPKGLDAFTVDAMPALRQPDGTLLVPEKASRKWIATDPEFLIAEVKRRQEEWDQFRPLVRLLKRWREVQDTDLRSLTVEVLALKHLPKDENRPKALQKFFTAAKNAIDYPIEDPAGLCGPTQSELDRDKARAALDAAASASWHAVIAQERGETDRAACLWYSIFGDEFPQPPEGCPKDTSGTGFGPFSIGVGSTAARPVIDAPQG